MIFYDQTYQFYLGKEYHVVLPGQIAIISSDGKKVTALLVSDREFYKEYAEKQILNKDITDTGKELNARDMS